MKAIRIAAAMLALAACGPRSSNGLLNDLMMTEADFYSAYLQETEKYRIQILYTQIDRDSSNRPHFTRHVYRLDAGEYFYPASTIKLPLVLLALEKLNDLGIGELDKFTPMFTDSACCRQTRAHADSTSADDLPSVGHYIRKILLLSDNDASNRLYEFIGQEELHRRLAAKGYPGVRIVHRLSVPLTTGENLAMNPVRFEHKGKLIYVQPPSVSMPQPEPAQVQLGIGYLNGDSLVRNPMDFTLKNHLTLEDLHRMLRAIIFPETQPPDQRFGLSDADYRFVRQYMGQWPGETSYPPGAADHEDGYSKFIMLGGRGARPAGSVRIFNKVGLAYGFLIDTGYVCDPDSGVEFLLSAVIYVNENAIFNDDHYEYDSLGLPFLERLGQTIYRYELARERRYKAGLNEFRLPFGVDQNISSPENGIL